MHNALFVSITVSYPQLIISTESDPVQRVIKSDVLKNATCGWWSIDPKEAKGVKFVFGVYNRIQVVSAYRVVEKYLKPSNLPKAEWVTGQTLYYIPAESVSKVQWSIATQWKLERGMMPRQTNYGIVEVTPMGALASKQPKLSL